MPTAEFPAGTQTRDIFRTINGVNLNIGPHDRLRGAAAADFSNQGPLIGVTPAACPRIVLRDSLGYELDTYTTLQEAIYRAKWNVRTSGQSKTPLEWRLPKAPPPARPDLTRAFPPVKHPQLAGGYGKSTGIAGNVLEIDVDDVSFVKESLDRLPYVPSLSFLRQEILVGPKTYFQIVGTMLLHKRLLSETEKRHAIYNFPGFCSGCIRMGLCYGCERSSEPHYHEDKLVKTGGGFTYYKKDRPEREMKHKNPINWKINHPDQVLKRLMEDYAGVNLDGDVSTKINEHLDTHADRRIRHVSEDRGAMDMEYLDRDKRRGDDGRFLPEIDPRYINGQQKDASLLGYAGPGKSEGQGQSRGQSVDPSIDPSDVDIDMFEEEQGQRKVVSKRSTKQDLNGDSNFDVEEGRHLWERNGYVQSGARSKGNKSNRGDAGTRYNDYERYEHRLPKYRKTESDEDSDDEGKIDNEGDDESRGRKRDRLYKPPPPFKVKRSPKRQIEARSPFSTDRSYDIPKGQDFVPRKSSKKPTEFVDFRNVDVSWKEPKKFELKRGNHKPTKFWSGARTKKKEKSRSRSPKTRRPPSPRSLSPDSGLDTGFMTAKVRAYSPKKKKTKTESPRRVKHKKEKPMQTQEVETEEVEERVKSPGYQNPIDEIRDTATEFYKLQSELTGSEEDLRVQAVWDKLRLADSGDESDRTQESEGHAIGQNRDVDLDEVQRCHKKGPIEKRKHPGAKDGVSNGRKLVEKQQSRTSRSFSKSKSKKEHYTDGVDASSVSSLSSELTPNRYERRSMSQSRKAIESIHKEEHFSQSPKITRENMGTRNSFPYAGEEYIHGLTPSSYENAKKRSLRKFTKSKRKNLVDKSSKEGTNKIILKRKPLLHKSPEFINIIDERKDFHKIKTIEMPQETNSPDLIGKSSTETYDDEHSLREKTMLPNIKTKPNAQNNSSHRKEEPITLPILLQKSGNKYVRRHRSIGDNIEAVHFPDIASGQEYISDASDVSVFVNQDQLGREVSRKQKYKTVGTSRRKHKYTLRDIEEPEVSKENKTYTDSQEYPSEDGLRCTKRISNFQLDRNIEKFIVGDQPISVNYTNQNVFSREQRTQTKNNTKANDHSNTDDARPTNYRDDDPYAQVKKELTFEERNDVTESSSDSDHGNTVTHNKQICDENSKTVKRSKMKKAILFKDKEVNHTDITDSDDSTESITPKKITKQRQRKRHRKKTKKTRLKLNFQNAERCGEILHQRLNNDCLLTHNKSEDDSATNTSISHEQLKVDSLKQTRRKFTDDTRTENHYTHEVLVRNTSGKKANLSEIDTECQNLILKEIPKRILLENKQTDSGIFNSSENINEIEVRKNDELDKVNNDSFKIVVHNEDDNDGDLLFISHELKSLNELDHSNFSDRHTTSKQPIDYGSFCRRSLLEENAVDHDVSDDGNIGDDEYENQSDIGDFEWFDKAELENQKLCCPASVKQKVNIVSEYSDENNRYQIDNEGFSSSDIDTSTSEFENEFTSPGQESAGSHQNEKMTKGRLQVVRKVRERPENISKISDKKLSHTFSGSNDNTNEAEKDTSGTEIESDINAVPLENRRNKSNKEDVGRQIQNIDKTIRDRINTLTRNETILDLPSHKELDFSTKFSNTNNSKRRGECRLSKVVKSDTFGNEQNLSKNRRIETHYRNETNQLTSSVVGSSVSQFEAEFASPKQKSDASNEMEKLSERHFPIEKKTGKGSYDKAKQIGSFRYDLADSERFVSSNEIENGPDGTDCKVDTNGEITENWYNESKEDDVKRKSQHSEQTIRHPINALTRDETILDFPFDTWVSNSVASDPFGNEQRLSKNRQIVTHNQNDNNKFEPSDQNDLNSHRNISETGYKDNDSLSKSETHIPQDNDHSFDSKYTFSVVEISDTDAMGNEKRTDNNNKVKKMRKENKSCQQYRRHDNKMVIGPGDEENISEKKQMFRRNREETRDLSNYHGAHFNDPKPNVGQDIGYNTSNHPLYKSTKYDKYLPGGYDLKYIEPIRTEVDLREDKKLNERGNASNERSHSRDDKTPIKSLDELTEMAEAALYKGNDISNMEPNRKEEDVYNEKLNKRGDATDKRSSIRNDKRSLKSQNKTTGMSEATTYQKSSASSVEDTDDENEIKHLTSEKNQSNEDNDKYIARRGRYKYRKHVAPGKSQVLNTYPAPESKYCRKGDNENNINGMHQGVMSRNDLRELSDDVFDQVRQQYDKHNQRIRNLRRAYSSSDVPFKNELRKRTLQKQYVRSSRTESEDNLEIYRTRSNSENEISQPFGTTKKFSNDSKFKGYGKNVHFGIAPRRTLSCSDTPNEIGEDITEYFDEEIQKRPSTTSVRTISIDMTSLSPHLHMIDPVSSSLSDESVSPPLIPGNISFDMKSVTSQEPELDLEFDYVIDVANLEEGETAIEIEASLQNDERRRKRHRHKKRRRKHERLAQETDHNVEKEDNTQFPYDEKEPEADVNQEVQPDRVKSGDDDKMFFEAVKMIDMETRQFNSPFHRSEKESTSLENEVFKEDRQAVNTGESDDNIDPEMSEQDEDEFIIDQDQLVLNSDKEQQLISGNEPYENSYFAKEFDVNESENSEMNTVRYDNISKADTKGAHSKVRHDKKKSRVRKKNYGDIDIDFATLPSIETQVAKIMYNYNYDDQANTSISGRSSRRSSRRHSISTPKITRQRMFRSRSESKGSRSRRGSIKRAFKKKRSKSLPNNDVLTAMKEKLGVISDDVSKEPVPVPIYLGSFPSRIAKKQFKTTLDRKRVQGRGRSMSMFITDEDGTNKSELEPLREESQVIDTNEMDRVLTPSTTRIPTPASTNSLLSNGSISNTNTNNNTSVTKPPSTLGEGHKQTPGVRDDTSCPKLGKNEPVKSPVKREIIKKERRPKTPVPAPVRSPSPVEELPHVSPTPEPIDDEEPVSREISFEFIREPPELPPIEVPELPDIPESQPTEYKGIKREKKLIEVSSELPAQKKKFPPPPKPRPQIRSRAPSRKTKVAEAPVTTQELQQMVDPLDFLAKYCIINPDRLPFYERVFNGALSVQTPRYPRGTEPPKGAIVHLPPAQLSDHELNMLKDITVLNKGHCPRNDGISAPEQYLEKLNYSMEFIKSKQDVIQTHMEKVQAEKMRYMAEMAKKWDRDIVRLDYKTKTKKKKKQKKKKKKGEEPDYDQMGALSDKTNFQPMKASDITDEVIVSRMDDKMMKKMKKDPIYMKYKMELGRDIEKLKHYDERVSQIEDEKDLVGLYCMDYYFSEQGAMNRPQEFRRQQSRLYQKLHPDPDIEMNIEEVEPALQQINNKLLTEREFQYIYFILDLPKREKINFRLFSIVAALSEKVTQMDPVIRKLINKVDYNALDVKLEKSKELFQLLQDERVLPHGNAPSDNLAVELTAGGLTPEHTTYVMNKFDREGRGFIDFLDFVTYVPLFIEIHGRIIDDPFNDTLCV